LYVNLLTGDARVKSSRSVGSVSVNDKEGHYGNGDIHR